MDEMNQAIEAAKQELAMLQAEIDTLKARRSIEPPQVEVTILEQDYEQIIQQARSAAWIEQKISELQRIGDRLWHQLNQKEMLKAAIQRAEEAEIRYRRLEQQISQARNQVSYDLDDGADREIDPFTWDDREID